MRTSRGGGVILVGAAGVGKTRLLDEVLDRPPFSTWSTTRFVATEPSRTVPLAALFSLLPPAPVGDRSQMLAYLRSSLLERADGRRVLVAVDDAHLLDDVSAAFLGELVHRDDIVLAVTARSGTPMPSPLTGLWTSGVLERVDIDPLDAAATLELAEDVVGGSIDPSLGAEVVALSGGNPLLIREILLDASSSGTVRPESGAWTSVAPLRSGPRVQELVLARTGRLPAEARAVLDLVAIADPLDLALLDDQESEHLDRLEREGLVELRRGEVGLHARVEHPLVGEAIAASLPTRRRLEVLRALSDRTATAGCPNEGDALRAARWALLAGDVPPARLAAAAANESLRTFDLDTAAELAECALSTGPCSDAAIVLADVRRLQGNTEAARRAVEEGLADATDEHQRARATEVLALLLTHQLGRPSEAVELLRATAAGLGDAGLARRLDGMATHLSGLLGAYPEVVTATRQAIEVEGLDPDERAVLLHNLVYAQVMLGQIDGVDDRIQEALELGAPSATQEIVDLLWALRTGVHVQRGELADGARLAEAHIERCRADGHVFITTGAILCQLLAHLGSVRVFDLADELLAGRGGPDAFGVTPIILGTAAYARARSGDPDGARALLAQVPDDLEDDRTLPFVAAGRAALLTAVGEPLQAAEVALEGGQRAVETTHAAFGIVALHAGVGCGRSATLAELLGSAAADVDGALLRTMADHAVAWRDQDAKALDAAAMSFALMDARPHAASGFAHAAATYEPDSAAARRAAARAALWNEAASPFRVPSVDVVSPLTDRELDIARRAATGQSSRAIADDVYLSVRTVDNHLRNAYRKLGVNGRPELVEVLDPLPPGGAGLCDGRADN